jgi:hypothetical protein
MAASSGCCLWSLCPHQSSVENNLASALLMRMDRTRDITGGLPAVTCAFRTPYHHHTIEVTLAFYTPSLISKNADY